MFEQRSYQKEILDECYIQKDLLYQNLNELEFINAFLGGHRITLKGLKAAIIPDQFSLIGKKLIIDFYKLLGLIDKHSQVCKVKQQFHVIDIGCGGGDSLKAMARWSKKEGFNIQLTGIDIKSDCIDYAQENCKYFEEINFSCNDFINVFKCQKPIDIVHASLFCHHFTEAELIGFIKLCNDHKAIFIINDLERNSVAYYLIKFLTGIFSKSPLVKNDAPLSVLRGFKKTEWNVILQQAGIKKYSIQNYWAFRHLIIAYPNE